MSTQRKKYGGKMAGTNTLTAKNSKAVASVASTARIGKSTYGGGSRTVLSSSSRRNVGVGGASEKGMPSTTYKAPVQVINDSGQDVTPQPLLQLDPGTVRQKQSNILGDSSGGTPTDLMSQTSIYQTGTVSASTFGGGPFTRSVFSQSHSGATGSISDDIGDTTDVGTAIWPDRHTREEVKEELTEEDLDKIVGINLTETDTIWLLDMPGVAVSVESDEAPEIREKNARYQELVKSMVGNDRYVERSMNTFNEAPKIKNIQTTKINYSDKGITATNWDMYDSFKEVAEAEAKAKAAKKKKVPTATLR